ncbi:hypothetical protein FACS1894205_1320 [Alphaproteobacteria bacterium]|nr:hypothetical protein FACS1894205_1320 [Alphaproteobacteria bacterium]
MQNENAYPLKYALLCVHDLSESILEAGCGNGRVLRYFKERGYAITGMDFIEEAVQKLKQADPELDVETGDITDLRWQDETFNSILAFGLYHNLRDEALEQAMRETTRILKHGGKLCASFRADNIANRINDWHTNYRSRNSLSCGDIASPTLKEFHKLNLTEKEFSSLVRRYDLKIKQFYYVENMSFLYKFQMFRHAEHRQFDESKGRREGYLLSGLGRGLQNILMRLLPSSFCSIYVVIARKT